MEFHDDPIELHRQLARVTRALHLPVRRQVPAFFDDTLRSTARVPIPLPVEIDRLYQELKQRAEDGRPSAAVNATGTVPLAGAG
jgi:hypothetical protein